MVGAAHCTYLCKSPSSSKILPNCCCPNVGGTICIDNPECEDDAKTVDMTGEDAEIICGEWETGSTPANESGEENNIILPILKIIRHPDYQIVRGEANSQYIAADIAVFVVNDDNLEASTEIHTACLPKSDQSLPSYGVHAGWSSPPPIEFLEENLPPFVARYTDFHKLWHHNMTFKRCEDPDSDTIFSNETLKYPSNSFYPPGTICASEIFEEFCPTSGESGSPLMSIENGKYILQGLQSFREAYKKQKN